MDNDGKSTQPTETPDTVKFSRRDITRAALQNCVTNAVDALEATGVPSALAALRMIKNEVERRIKYEE